MTIQATLFPSDASLPNVILSIPDGAAPHLLLTFKPSATRSSYNPYYTEPSTGAEISIDEIEVVYTGASTADFVLRGATNDGKKPEIFRIDHLASTSMTTAVWWDYPDTDTIVWTFEDPTTVDTWVSWDFNNSGTAPPVKVKVVLKRQT